MIRAMCYEIREKMQQFTVPQFISIENQIIGPITTRQFVIMMAGFVLMGICYKLLTFWAFSLISVIIFAISGIVAFLKINGQPFHYYILNLSQYFKKPRLRVWDVEVRMAKEAEEEVKVQLPSRIKKRIAASRLSELSLIVDTGGTYKGE